MNRLEDELTSLNGTIALIKHYLRLKKSICYDDWCKAHEYLEELIVRRDELLVEVEE